MAQLQVVLTCSRKMLQTRSKPTSDYRMQAEIITIGDEILIGQIVDTNSAFLGKELNKIGVSVYQITSIQDDKSAYSKSFKGG